VFGFFWLFLIVFGCFWLFLVVFGCFWLFLVVFGCFWLFLVVFGCFWLFVLYFISSCNVTQNHTTIACAGCPAGSGGDHDLITTVSGLSSTSFDFSYARMHFFPLISWFFSLVIV
jgi:hypothetical protein